MPVKQGIKINSRVALNSIKIESLPSFTFSGSNAIIPFGLDNYYPSRIIDAIKKSPTALGCVKRQAEFIFGNGIANGLGDIVVNRDNETLNDIVWQCIRHGYSPLNGYCLHFNFNVFGQISEMFFVSPEYVRKHRTMDKIDYGIWRFDHTTFLMHQPITIDLYDSVDAKKAIQIEGLEYKGQLKYISRDMEIYPTSPLDSAIISVSYEKEAQIYPYANIRNGFSGNFILKYPTLAQGENATKEANEVSDNVKKLTGAENAGSGLVVPMQVGVTGETKPFEMIEHLSPVNVDTLFLNQNEKAERDILKVMMMPSVLLGVPNDGMFNEASFADAFNYKNSDTEIDRKAIEREFNKILPRSVFGIDKIELVPFNRMVKS